MLMVLDYENLLVNGVLFDLNLKKLGIWLIWEFLEILDVKEEMSCCLIFKRTRSVT